MLEKVGPVARFVGVASSVARAEKSGPSISGPALSGLGESGGVEAVSASDVSESDGR